MNKKIAVFPGSFSPFTNGHLSIVKRALPLFDEIIIAIGINSQKENYFSIGERSKWITKIFENEEKISVQKYEGLTVDFCQKMNAKYILRGLRNSHDFKYEKGISQINHSMDESIETIFIITEPKFSHISSTLVRDVIKNGGDVSQFIPKEIEV
jgi:pantetheine-phosphate adenylyltransferase